MTTDELKALARRQLEFGIEELRETGELVQKFTLVKRGGRLDIIFVEGAVTNDAGAKEALAMTLRKRVAPEGIEAVLMLSDVFWGTMRSREAELLRRSLDLNVEESAAMGLCDKHEAVMVTLESPILNQVLRQEYRREGDGTVIVLVGELFIRDDTSPDMKVRGGRFTGFFPHAAGHA